MAAMAAARAIMPIAKKLTPEVFEEGWSVCWAPRSDAGIGGMVVAVELLLLGAPAVAPGVACCAWVEVVGAAVTALAVPAPEEAEPTAYGISRGCAWAINTMLRLV